MKWVPRILRTYGYVPAQARDEAIAAEEQANEQLRIAIEAKQKTDDLNRNLRATVDELQGQLFRAQQDFLDMQRKTLDWFARMHSGRPIFNLQPEQAGPPSIASAEPKPTGRRQARDVINEVSEADRQWWEEQKKAAGMTEARQTEAE